MPGIVPEIEGKAVRDLPEEGTDRTGDAGTPQAADHAGQPEQSGDYAEPCEPDGVM